MTSKGSGLKPVKGTLLAVGELPAGADLDLRPDSSAAPVPPFPVEVIRWTQPGRPEIRWCYCRPWMPDSACWPVVETEPTWAAAT
jgi:hypothetical protein